MATVLTIESYNSDDAHIASLDRFVTRDGGDIDSEIVIQKDNIVPYCLDHKSRRVIFTDLPSNFDLTREPFLYIAQKELARRLIAVPFAEIADLAAQVDAPKKLIFLHTHNRAGSTLMHQVLNQVSGVRSFSQPFFFANFFPVLYHSDEPLEFTDLLVNCTKLFTYPFVDSAVVFKPWGQTLAIMDVLQAAFPDAQHLFLYRNPINYCRSWEGIHMEWGDPERDVKELLALNARVYGEASYLEQVIPEGVEKIRVYLEHMAYWFWNVESYHEVYNSGIPIAAVRYEDMIADRESIIKQVLTYLEFPVDHIDRTLRPFDRDSQLGTGLARMDETSEFAKLDFDQIQHINQMLTDHPLNLQPNSILPGTLPAGVHNGT